MTTLLGGWLFSQKYDLPLDPLIDVLNGRLLRKRVVLTRLRVAPGELPTRVMEPVITRMTSPVMLTPGIGGQFLYIPLGPITIQTDQLPPEGQPASLIKFAGDEHTVFMVVRKGSTSHYSITAI